MVRRELFNLAKSSISERNRSFEARELVCHALGISSEELLMTPDADVPDELYSSFAELLRRRVSGEPLAYVLGEWDFYGRRFELAPGILIPRPETELLVALALPILEKCDKPRVLDLCCGSGCIGITLAAESSADVTLGDISATALEYTRKNALLNGVSCDIRYDDALLPPSDDSGQFDLIISNPPYISKSEYDTLDDEVRQYEPQLALLGGDDGLSFYRAIAHHRYSSLRRGGSLIFEFGEKQSNAVSEILEDEGYTQVKIYDDLSGKTRASVSRRP